MTWHTSAPRWYVVSVRDIQITKQIRLVVNMSTRQYIGKDSREHKDHPVISCVEGTPPEARVGGSGREGGWPISGTLEDSRTRIVSHVFVAESRFTTADTYLCVNEYRSKACYLSIRWSVTVPFPVGVRKILSRQFLWYWSSLNGRRGICNHVV